VPGTPDGQYELDPDAPVEILRALPARFHDQFLREYYGAAAGAARQVGGYRQLHDVLRLWRLTATAQSRLRRPARSHP